MKKQEQPRLYRSVKYEYDPFELRKLGENLAHEAINVYTLEQKKKEVTAELGAELKSANGRVAELARKVSAGHEYRDVEVDVVFDAPTRGQKQFIDLRTGLVVGDPEAMSEEDRQASLELE